ncbi:30S ribosomal protein S5 [Sulfolobus acidocaldarius]|uniref:Small ribosomal subunit protein uS5 n=5 Tax=Sulfolobus acidocaldarius TaxID=2285 RepID=RS5_SULAC|nr:30S ribosomal protein S5 [Sulfolobus acidocaldarius]O05641.1 RecName: Full=Small ribosomal subunit protein uS5; AltName: Full=30S ribosomal protein S5 [Sulfolobus acidocaldarius DSM 639]AHC50983.1 30S ribosomal protein S5 [Sulfolobus acidocaldarius SUSAZ]AAY79969.1 30S ribosomal protein S5P [Sulfolobus acidocaldarius DSM 639]ALU29100.1 30S ribosomal protein S5 [Sulfolobus acidocaldarius]ALU32816.1 30S ribosomal protein S5 [Sulfolobus acidocaldarius]CAA69097.1 ribosomal protein S5 [Sulfolob
MSEEVPVIKLEDWKPRTKVGQLIKEGKINSMKELFERNLPIVEPEIVDVLLPKLRYDIVDIGIVQKQTDAGELSRYKVLIVMGNMDGYISYGTGKAKQLRVAIQKAIRDAKMRIIPVRRGCGSWECTCGESHSLPFIVSGKAGSVEVTLLPAPKGTGLVVGSVLKTFLSLAGLKDVWSRTKGSTYTHENFIKAAYIALYNTYRFVTPVDWGRMK